MKPADALVARTQALLQAKGVREPIEATKQRTPTSKTFDLGNGTFHVSKRLRPVHYKDGGVFKEINTAIRGRAVTGAPYIARLLPSAIGFRYESRRGGWMQIELATLDGEQVNAKPPRIDDDTAYWDNIAPDVSMYFKALPTHPEIFKVYGSAPHTTVWTVTSSPDFPGVFNDRTTGKDAAGDNTEVVTEFDGKTFTEEVTGRVSRISEGEKRRRKKQWFTDPALPLLVDAAIQENIGDGADDVDSIATFVPAGGPASSEVMQAGNEFLSVGFSVSETANSHLKWLGLRFRTLDIPAGATVSDATLTVNVLSVNPGSSDLAVKLYGNDVDDAGLWADPTNRPKDITKTTASTTFTPATSGLKQINVTTLVAEILARGGWTANNDLAIGFFPQVTGVITDFEGRAFSLEAFEAAGTDEAQLDITYTEGAPAAADNARMLWFS